MELNRTNNINFNGLKITAKAQETIRDMFHEELDRAENTYNTSLNNKHKKRQNYKNFNDEQLFNTCFCDVWNKLDYYDTVTINYALSNYKDMYIRQNNRGLIIETFTTDKDGNQVKNEHKNIKRPSDFFHYFKRKFFETLK